ncbi:MAG: hypothetical protein F4X98_11075 [Gammaproteobacteria bacterium]|nr:hypothetical protein [Gammaproteobacteria bacterium]
MALIDEVTAETAVAILLAARDLLSDESKWTRGALARDSKGDEVDCMSPDASYWSAFGAVLVASAADPEDGVLDWDADATVMALERLERNAASLLRVDYGPRRRGFVVEFNDRPATKFQDVMSLFEGAINERQRD